MLAETKQTYQTFTPKNKLRFLTATALFDGHDASINIMRRLLQARGAEVIHLGHNRAAAEIVAAAIQEDVQAIAVSCYQGGHSELSPYLRELLDAQGCTEVRLFGGGGGVGGSRGPGGGRGGAPEPHLRAFSFDAG